MEETKYKPIGVSEIQLEKTQAEERFSPMFCEKRGKDWIPYTTQDGKEQYPDLLVSLANNSALHNAILKSKTAQVAGEGFVWDDSSTAEVNTAMQYFMENINEEQDANELLWRISTDLELFNGIALLVTWTSDWTKIGSVKHLDFSKVRAAKVDETGKIPGYYYSWDWGKQRNDRVFIPAFNETTAAKNKQAYQEAVEKGNSEELQKIFLQPTTQILYWKPYAPNSFYYPLPSYVGALASIETDILSDEYGFSSFENGLNTDIIVTMIGANTDEERNDLARRFLRQYTGAAKSRMPIIAFADETDKALKVEKIGVNKEDGLFTTINENTMQKILSGHRITDPLLVGIKTAGQLGASEELKRSIQFWYSTVIIPEQQVITKIFNKFMDINGYPEVSIEPLNLVVEEEGEEQPEEVNSELGNENQE